MDNAERDKISLSDRILSALQISLQKEDLKIPELLTKAMEQSMTRNAGGGEFIERRDYPPEMEEVMGQLHELREKHSS